MSIFKDFAPKYWAAGLPAMPLKRWNAPGRSPGKAPILNEWTQYGEHMPSEAMRASWLSNYPDSNIGLPFGQASGLCAIDIDTEDEELVQAIRDALPPSPWVRIGKKGMGLIYRWNGQANFKLRDSENQSIVEFLGFGNQMVMPPSIHPDTGKPYTANAELYDVMDKVVGLPADVEKILRSALEPVVGKLGLSLAQAGRSGPVEVVPQGERDIQLVRHAGYLARVVLGIDKRTKFTLKEAMEQMYNWVENFTTSVSGDDIDPDKGVAKLLEFLLKDVESGKTLPNGWDDGLTDNQREHPAIAEMLKLNEVQRWTFTKAKAWLRENVALKPGDTDWAWSKINELTDLLAKDENFKESEYKLLFGVFKEEMGSEVKLSKPDLTSLFRDARSSDHEQAADHEAIARQIYEEINRGGKLIHAREQFWQWSGACFEPLDDSTVVLKVSEDVKGNALARRHNDYVAVAKTIALIANGDLATGNEPGVNFANGYLDSSMTLQDHDPKYGQTFTLKFNYIPERAGEAHKWLQFLEDCWGDDPDYFEKVNALQEAFAATLFGKAWEYQTAFLLYGQAGTGKTQVLEVLQALMPADGQSSVPPEVWGERFQDAPMVGKSLNVCGELSESAIINGKKFKEIVEGQIQQSELKGKQIFNYRPTAAQWFSSNFLPRTRDTSEGFIRRWLVWEFNRVVPREQRVVNFHKTLIAEEREAIAAWAVQGLERLEKQRDYTRPASSKDLLNLMRRANNSVIAFIQSSEKIRVDERKSADLRGTFDQYVMYMKDMVRGWSVTYERFKQMIKEAGYQVRPYTDGVGINREEIVGLELLQAVLPPKGH